MDPTVSVHESWWHDVLLVDEAVNGVADVLVGRDQKGANQDHARGDLGVDGEHERLDMVVVEGEVLLHWLKQAAQRHLVEVKICSKFARI